MFSVRWLVAGLFLLVVVSPETRLDNYNQLVLTFGGIMASVEHTTAGEEKEKPEKVEISTLDKHEGKEVTIRGWVSKIQTFKRHSFLKVRDGAGKQSTIQVYLPQGEPVIDLESYVEITGMVVALPVGKFSTQPRELRASGYRVIGASEGQFANKCPEHAGPAVKLELRHLYLREPLFAVIIKLRALLVEALRLTFKEMGSTEIIPPCFVGNQCEGGATLFKLPYPPVDKGPDIEAYLTQSSQFYLEMAVPAVGDCYCIYPSFRAERSHTRRHLTEFLHAEAEWKDVMTFEEHLAKLKTLVTLMLKHFLALDAPLGLLKELARREDVEAMAKLPFVTMTHADAIEYCKTHEIYADEETKKHFGPEDDIPEAQERKMVDQIGKIVLLTEFPKHFKSFYMASRPDKPSVVLGCDVEVPGVGEIIGSGVRVQTVQELRARLEEQGLKEKDYVEYIDLRRYGFAQTSGMGLGVDRVLTWLLGTHSIRDVVTYPRVPGRLTP